MNTNLKWLAILMTFFLVSYHLANAQWVQTNGPYGGEVYTLAVSGNNIFAGTKDGGVFLSTNNGASWTAVNNGLPAYFGIHSLAVSGTNIFVGTDSGVFLSTDNGAHWTAVNNGLTCLNVYRLAASGTGGIFAGSYGDGVFLSTNNGTSWTAVNNGLTDSFSEHSCCVYSLAVSGSTIFAGIGAYGVFLSTDNGAKWTAALGPMAIWDFAVSGAGSIFAGTNLGIFFSTNNGVTWRPLYDGLPGTAYCLAASGSNIFAGVNCHGVFLSPNNGVRWTDVNNGLPDIFCNNHVYCLAVSATDIFAGTSFSTVFRRPLSEVVGVVNQGRKGIPEPDDLIMHSPSLGSHNVTIAFSLLHSGHATVEIFDLSGHRIASLVNMNLESGTHNIPLNIQNLSAGCYTVKIQAGANTVTKSFPIIH